MDNLPESSQLRASIRKLTLGLRTEWVESGFPKRSCANKKLERDADRTTTPSRWRTPLHFLCGGELLRQAIQHSE